MIYDWRKNLSLGYARGFDANGLEMLEKRIFKVDTDTGEYWYYDDDTGKVQMKKVAAPILIKFGG